MEPTFEHRIHERAYFLSAQWRWSPATTHFWLIAERELLTEVAMESAAASQLTETIQAGKAKPTAVLTAQQRAVERAEV